MIWDIKHLENSTFIPEHTEAQNIISPCHTVSGFDEIFRRTNFYATLSWITNGEFEKYKTWCVENCVGDYLVRPMIQDEWIRGYRKYPVICFELESDAIAFKLVWCQ